jgi:hypothetical protein
MNLDLPEQKWRKSTRSGGEGHCVEVANVHTAVAVRDSKDPDGPKVILTRTGWRALADSVKSGDYDIA